MFLILSHSMAFGSCNIIFENEVTEYPPMHRLFKYVLRDRSVLESEGYNLISEDDVDKMDFAGTIEIKKFRRSKYIELALYDFKTESEKKFKVPYKGAQVSIERLLKKIPHCR